MFLLPASIFRRGRIAGHPQSSCRASASAVAPHVLQRPQTASRNGLLTAHHHVGALGPRNSSVNAVPRERDQISEFEGQDRAGALLPFALGSLFRLPARSDSRPRGGWSRGARAGMPTGGRRMRCESLGLALDLPEVHLGNETQPADRRGRARQRSLGYARGPANLESESVPTDIADPIRYCASSTLLTLERRVPDDSPEYVELKSRMEHAAATVYGATRDIVKRYNVGRRRFRSTTDSS